MHRAVVYHTISAPETPLPSALEVSRENFDAHLKWLASRRERVASLHQFLSVSEQKKLIAITFDDGYRENLTVALPLLEKYRLPVTLFIVTGFIGRENYLSADEIKFLAKHQLVTIGSHSHTHRYMSSLSQREARCELTESKTILEDITNQKIDLFAYPYGDCDETTERLSAECGYRAAWSVLNGKNTAFSRWRVPLNSDDSLISFIAKVSPAYFSLKRVLKPLLN